MDEPKIIKSDEDAIALLECWIAGKKLPQIEFQSWPVLRITVKGDDYDASINASQMTALVALKQTMGRTYSVLAHGAYDMRRLNVDEEQEVEFVTTLRRGSSESTTDFTPLVQALASAAYAHPDITLAAGIVCGLMLSARFWIKKYFENRAKELAVADHENTMNFALSAFDAGRLATVESATRLLEKQFPQLARVVPQVQTAFWQFASASTDADEMQIAGITLSHDDLERLSERRRKRPRDVREYSGTFKVVAIRKVRNAYSVQLESKQLALSVTFRRPQLTDVKIKRLFNCLSNDQRIDARLEIREVERSLMGGRLMAFSPATTD